MAYSRTTWVDGTTPAINATNLNNIEQGIVDLDNGTVKLTGDQTVAGNKTFTGTVTIQASGNPADGGGGTIRTAGSRYTLVLLPRNADATYATASEFYYDSTYVGWWAESKMGCTGDFTCNAYGYFAGNLRAMKASGDTQIEVRTVTGNPYLSRTSDTTADIYDIWKIDGTSRYYIRATTSQFLIQRYDSTPITAIGIGRTDGKVTIGTVTGAAGLELGDSGPREMVGTGSPESSVTAPAGSVWRQTDDATFSYLKWYKATGTGSTGWLPDYEGRWKDFTPTLKDSGGTTLSGWTCTGRYTVRGKWCQVIIDITASTPSAGTGEYRLYLPTDAQAATSSPVRWCAEGSLVAYDNSSGNLGWFRVSMTNAAYVTAWTPQTWPYSNGQHQLSATIPNFTWAASDKINGSFSYEIA